MIFNSIDFIIFLPIVFIIYWIIPTRKNRLKNFLILFSSYIFYGWWNWKFLFLIFSSTVIDYTIGHYLYKSVQNKKKLLYLSIIVNLGFLFFFKYYNFFIDSFSNTFLLFGKKIPPLSLNIILPVGISFYTFQTLSYTIDVYKGKILPAKDFITFAAFVSFFPQLVAGPIERASNLLPQFNQERKFNYENAINGCKLILWGLFKKIVIADNCAHYTNIIFNNTDSYNASTLAIGAVFFTFQIYGDFSGYSDIAIGVSKLFNINLLKNFSTPYFSRDIAEFWRRWHISLSTWFRDYLYYPLGGSRVNLLKKISNIFVIFLVSGLWHGANWTFVFWGLLNALLYLPIVLLKKNRNNIEIAAATRKLPNIREFFQILLTFISVVFCWIFFRADNLKHAFNYTLGILNFSFFTKPSIYPKTVIHLILVFIIIEWIYRKEDFPFSVKKTKQHPVYSFLFYFIVGISIFLFGIFSSNDFIYFQF